MSRRVSYCFAIALASLAGAAPASAHDGPPYAIVVDHRAGPYVVSLWGDPDIGTGTFYVMLEAVDGAPFIDPTRVRVSVAPLSGRLAEATYDAISEAARSGARFVAQVAFDRGEMWRVRVIVDGPAGGGEFLSQVEATPDGMLGPIGLAVYSFPFALVAFVWWRAARARRRALTL